MGARQKRSRRRSGGGMTARGDRAPAPARVTVIQAFEPATLSKSYRLDGNGTLAKSPGGNVIEGGVGVFEFETLEDFKQLLMTLEPSMALAYGVPTAGAPEGLHLVTRKEWERDGKPEGTIARTRECFAWPGGPGVMFIDYDPAPEGPVLEDQALIACLEEAAPRLADAHMLWWPSSSSHIFNAETDDDLTGLRGQRLYLLVEDARDIPRAGRVLYQRLWLVGHGRIEISASGSLLERTAIDGMVFQPERLDFAAGAFCEAPLEQRRGAPAPVPPADGKGVEIIDTRAVFPDLTTEESAEFSRLVAEARAEAEPAAREVRERWLEARVDEIAPRLMEQRHDTDAVIEDEDALVADVRAEARRVATTALEGERLPEDFGIQLANGGTVTVGDLLASPSVYDGALTLDPLEPGYDGDKVVGRLFLKGAAPTLVSMAHGQKSYALGDPDARTRQRGTALAEKLAAASIEPKPAPRKRPQVSVSQLNAALVADTLAALRRSPRVFDKGDILTIDVEGELRSAVRSKRVARHYVSGEVEFVAWRKKGGEQATKEVKKEGGEWVVEEVNMPLELAQTLIDLESARGLTPLDAVTDVPFLRPDGSVVATPGYDVETRIIYAPTGVVPPVADAPSMDELRQALDVLTYPLRDFRFGSPDDAASALAAFLTGVVRSSLPTAPGIGFNAMSPGVGKTKLAMCSAILAGDDGATDDGSLVHNVEELRKTIRTKLLEGSNTLLLDEAGGEINSAPLRQLLTSPFYTGRILGGNESGGSTPNRLLVLFTANGLTFSYDMVRRVILCRIDPGVANPQSLRFDFDPVEHVRQHRLEMCAAALTLIRGRLVHGPETIRDDGVGSFELWNRFVRETVVWIGETLDERFGDPMETQREAARDDPYFGDDLSVTGGVRAIFGSEWFVGKEIIDILRPGYAPKQYKRPTQHIEAGVVQDLRDAFEESLGKDCFDNAKRFGKRLQKRFDGKRVGEFVWQRVYDYHTKLWKYRVIVADAGEDGVEAEAA